MENKSVGYVVGYDRELRELIIKGPKNDETISEWNYWFGTIAGFLAFFGLAFIGLTVFTFHL